MRAILIGLSTAAVVLAIMVASDLKQLLRSALDGAQPPEEESD